LNKGVIVVTKSRPVIDSFSGTNRFLSNFYNQPMHVKELVKGEPFDLTVATLEHAFQAAKAQPDDTVARSRIAKAATPGKAKYLGRSVCKRDNWDDIRVLVMYRLIKIKFARGSELAARLLETKNALLIEGNTWGDTFWGKVDGVGKNYLGRLLMRWRKKLQEDI